MTLKNALKKGKWVRLKEWRGKFDWWLKREGDRLVDRAGMHYPIDLNDIERKDWEIKKASE